MSSRRTGYDNQNIHTTPTHRHTEREQNNEKRKDRRGEQNETMKTSAGVGAVVAVFVITGDHSK